MTDPFDQSDVMAAFLGRKEPSTADRHPYRAFKPSEDEQRYLEFRVKFPEPSQSEPNGQLIQIWQDWRLEESIVLVYPKPLVITILGERLGELARAISEWKVEWLAEFDPVMHEPITNENEPFIRSITIVPPPPEEIPERGKRH
jgi:hypothetical protein